MRQAIPLRSLWQGNWEDITILESAISTRYSVNYPKEPQRRNHAMYLFNVKIAHSKFCMQKAPIFKLKLPSVRVHPRSVQEALQWTFPVIAI